MCFRANWLESSLWITKDAKFVAVFVFLRKTKTLIKMLGCTGWSESLFSNISEGMFSRIAANIHNITKTRLYNFDHLKPHFYIVKLGFSGVYIIFLIFALKHRLWVLVKTASPNLCFEQKCEKISEIFIWKIQFLEVIFFIYLNRRVF